MQESELSSWVGRRMESEALIEPSHVRRVARTLDLDAPDDASPLPKLWHWAFFTESMSTAELGADGHPPVGGFLPPSQGRSRMWAGGRVAFHRPLMSGAMATKASTVTAVKEKPGRTGSLLFVTVKHEYLQAGELAIDEEQDIVYRTPAPPRLDASAESAPPSEWEESIVPSTTLLFRYSAVTFNTHRIHYDFPYATDVEGYPGLVVHGPLIATLMLGAFERAHARADVARFSYRGLRPLFAPRLFQVAGHMSASQLAEVWAQQDGLLAHRADITLR